MATCKYCCGAGRRCGDVKTLDLKVEGANGISENRYEIYECTRPVHTTGVHIACFDVPNDDPKIKTMVHKSKHWTPDSKESRERRLKK